MTTRLRPYQQRAAAASGSQFSSMITVTISINGNAIYTRTAVNRDTQPSGFDKYDLDDGRTVLHKRREGAVPLAIKMLAEIREQDVESARIAAAKDDALRKWSKVTSSLTVRSPISVPTPAATSRPSSMRKSSARGNQASRRYVRQTMAQALERNPCARPKRKLHKVQEKTCAQLHSVQFGDMTTEQLKANARRLADRIEKLDDMDYPVENLTAELESMCDEIRKADPNWNGI